MVDRTNKFTQFSAAEALAAKGAARARPQTGPWGLGVGMQMVTAAAGRPGPPPPLTAPCLHTPTPAAFSTTRSGILPKTVKPRPVPRPPGRMALPMRAETRKPIRTTGQCCLKATTCRQLPQLYRLPPPRRPPCNKRSENSDGRPRLGYDHTTPPAPLPHRRTR